MLALPCLRDRQCRVGLPRFGDLGSESLIAHDPVHELEALKPSHVGGDELQPVDETLVRLLGQDDGAKFMLEGESS